LTHVTWRERGTLDRDLRVGDDPAGIISGLE
jgi:hypothetical protein